MVGLFFLLFVFFSVCLSSLSVSLSLCFVLGGCSLQNGQCIKSTRLWITVVGHTYVCFYPKHRCYLQPLHCFGCSFSILIKYIVKSLCSYTRPDFLATMRVKQLLHDPNSCDIFTLVVLLLSFNRLLPNVRYTSHSV